jgi:hypothetical protein
VETSVKLRISSAIPAAASRHAWATSEEDSSDLANARHASNHSHLPRWRAGPNVFAEYTLSYHRVIMNHSRDSGNYLR